MSRPDRTRDYLAQELRAVAAKASPGNAAKYEALAQRAETGEFDDYGTAPSNDYVVEMAMHKMRARFGSCGQDTQRKEDWHMTHPDRDDLIRKLAFCLDVALPELVRRAKRERERYDGSGLREITDQDRLATARKALAEASEILGVPLGDDA